YTSLSSLLTPVLSVFLILFPSVLFYYYFFFFFFFFSSRRRHTRSYGDWSSDVCSSDLSCSGWSIVISSINCTRRRAKPSRRRTRSEERRVGKECRSRWSADH